MEEENTKKKQKTEWIDFYVGGTQFSATKSTLCAKSNYFERLLSKDWRKEEEVIRIEKHPATFSIIFKFILGYSLSSEVCIANHL
jgi:hypothetical protein